MADSTSEGTKALPVRGIYLYFKTLEGATSPDGSSALESFLAECDRMHLTVGVSDALYEVGHNHFSQLVRVDAAGPDCPACPNPPRL
jgi:hypothetical protein